VNGNASLKRRGFFILLHVFDDRLGTKAGMTPADQGEKSDEWHSDKFHQ
jgi:hypothetical protein